MTTPLQIGDLVTIPHSPDAMRVTHLFGAGGVALTNGIGALAATLGPDPDGKWWAAEIEYVQKVALQ